jgi:hypothetical protein
MLVIRLAEHYSGDISVGLMMHVNVQLASIRNPLSLLQVLEGPLERVR